MRTPVVLAPAVLASTVAVVLVTGTFAAADVTPSPTPWTVTDTRPTPAPLPATSSPSTVPPTSSSTAPETSATSSTMQGRLEPVTVPGPSRHRSTSRTGPRPSLVCQDTPGAVWWVRPGDTLWRIATCTGRDLADLVTGNDLPDGGRLIYPGDRIDVR